MKVEKVGRVSTESVFKCTGKHWDEWIKILNKAGAQKWVHKTIAAHLRQKYKLSPWWQQGVATGYEYATGMKAEGQGPAGFATVATRTIPIPANEVWALLQSKKGLSCWLDPISDFSFKKGMVYETGDGVFGEVRTLKTKSKVRMTWAEIEWLKPSTLQIYIVPRKGGKSVLVFQQEKLPDGRVKNQMKEHWKKVLTKLAQLSSLS